MGSGKVGGVRSATAFIARTAGVAKLLGLLMTAAVLQPACGWIVPSAVPVSIMTVHTSRNKGCLVHILHGHLVPAWARSITIQAMDLSLESRKSFREYRSYPSAQALRRGRVRLGAR